MISFGTRVVSVTEEFRDENYRLDVDGKSWIHDRVSIGWFVLLAGSHEKIKVGDDRPEIAVGDEIVVTIERGKRP